MQDMDELIESRQKALVSEKRAAANGTLNANERKESEIIHRTALLRLCISGLTQLRWPPALAAFADPLQDLLHDKAIFMDAMLYVYKVAILPTSSSDSYIEHHSRDHLGSDKSAITSVVSAQKTNVDSSFSSSDSPPKAVKNKSSHQSMSGFSDAGSETDLRNAVHALDVDQLDHSQPTSARSCVSGSSTARSGAFNSIRGVQTASSDAIRPDQAALLATLKVLQQQNQLLGRQLHTVHSANRRRDEAEGRVDATLLDLLQAVEEAAALSKDSSKSGELDAISTAVQSNPYIPDTSFVSEEEERSFQREVQREKQAKVASAAVNLSARKGISIGRATARTADVSGSTTSGGSSRRVTSTLIWSQVHSRLQSLYKQWTESRSDARNNYSRFCEEQRRLSKRDKGGEGDGRTRGGRGGHSHRAALSQRALGVSAPQASHSSFSTSWSDSADTSVAFEPAGVFLDAPRTHLLQTDLLHFSNAAYRFLHSESEADEMADDGVGSSRATDNAMRMSSAESRPASGKSAASTSSAGTRSSSWATVDPLPTSRKAIAQADALEVLQRRSQELALHLASYSSCAPLARSGTAGASMNTTALAALVTMANELATSSNLRKRDSASWERLQSAMDSAQNEHLTLHHCLQQANKQSRSQRTAARALAPLVDQLSVNVQKLIRDAVTPLQSAVTAVTTVLGCLAEAEKASVVDRQGTRVQPLDALARGHLGEQTSQLINALRLHRSEFTELETMLRDLTKNVHQAALRESRAFAEAKEKMLATVDLAPDGSDVGMSSMSSPRPTASSRPAHTHKSTPPKTPSHPVDDARVQDWAHLAYQNVQQAKAAGIGVKKESGGGGSRRK